MSLIFPTMCFDHFTPFLWFISCVLDQRMKGWHIKWPLTFLRYVFQIPIYYCVCWNRSKYLLCLSQSHEFSGAGISTCHEDKIWPVLEVTLSTRFVCMSLKCLFKSAQYICGGAWDQNQDWMHVNYALFMFFLCVLLSREWIVKVPHGL